MSHCCCPSLCGDHIFIDSRKSTYVPLKSKCTGLFIDHPAWLDSLTAVTPAHDLSCSITPPVSSLSDTQSNALSSSFFCVCPPTPCFSSFSLSTVHILHHRLPSSFSTSGFAKQNLSKCKNVAQTNCCHLFISITVIFSIFFCCCPKLMSNCNRRHPSLLHLPARHSRDRHEVIRQPWQLIAAPSRSTIGILQP